MRVLMTGAGGFIGSRIRPILRERYEFRAVDVVPVDDGLDSHVADITKLPEVEPLMEGVDVVMHLAIASGHAFKGRRDEFNEAQLDVNVKGTYNVLEAARRADVKRVVIASSVTAVFGYPLGRYVAASDSACPNSLYAATKHFGEVLGELYSRLHGLSVICWRIGAPVDHTTNPTKPRTDERRERRLYVSFVDLANGFATAAEVDDVPFGVFPLLSDNYDCFLDVTQARYILGYEPVHKFTETGVETLREWP